jgi:hypothetical protein
VTILILNRSQKPMALCDANRQWGLMTDAPNTDPAIASFVEQLLCKLGTALLFAIMLAMATNAGLVQGLRFISAICLLTSSWHFGVALIRRRPLSGLSEWGEAAIFSLIAGCALLLSR